MAKTKNRMNVEEKGSQSISDTPFFLYSTCLLCSEKVPFLLKIREKNIFYKKELAKRKEIR